MTSTSLGKAAVEAPGPPAAPDDAGFERFDLVFDFDLEEDVDDDDADAAGAVDAGLF